MRSPWTFVIRVNSQLLPHICMRGCGVLGMKGVFEQFQMCLRSGELIPSINKHLLFKKICMKWEVWEVLRKAWVCVWNKGLEGTGISVRPRSGCRTRGPEQHSALQERRGKEFELGAKRGSDRMRPWMPGSILHAWSLKVRVPQSCYLNSPR